MDWVAALAMQDYVRRNFEEGAPHQVARWKHLSDSLTRDLASYVREGKVALSFERLAAQLPSLSLALKDWPDCRFFARAGASIDRLLRHSSATVTLRIEAFRAHERRHLERLLRRLSRHGDRVTVIVSEGLRGLVQVDSSRFHLALGDSALQG
jgi:hypothetical protein